MCKKELNKYFPVVLSHLIFEYTKTAQFIWRLSLLTLETMESKEILNKDCRYNIAGYSQKQDLLYIVDHLVLKCFHIQLNKYVSTMQIPVNATHVVFNQEQNEIYILKDNFSLAVVSYQNGLWISQRVVQIKGEFRVLLLICAVHHFLILRVSTKKTIAIAFVDVFTGETQYKKLPCGYPYICSTMNSIYVFRTNWLYGTPSKEGLQISLNGTESSLDIPVEIKDQRIKGCTGVEDGLYLLTLCQKEVCDFPKGYDWYFWHFNENNKTWKLEKIIQTQTHGVCPDLLFFRSE